MDQLPIDVHVVECFPASAEVSDLVDNEPYSGIFDGIRPIEVTGINRFHQSSSDTARVTDTLLDRQCVFESVGCWSGGVGHERFELGWSRVGWRSRIPFGWTVNKWVGI